MVPYIDWAVTVFLINRAVVPGALTAAASVGI